MRDTCPSCPNRWMADLFDALGSTDKAQEIREAGCTWWWHLQYEEKETGQTKVVGVCGASALPDLLKRYGSDVARAGSAVQQDREEQRRALESIEAHVGAIGLPAVVGELAKHGLRGYLGQEIRALPEEDQS